MRILYERCCGLDIHKVSIAVCVVITRDGKTEEETRRCGTMTADLLELAAWLKARGIQQVKRRLVQRLAKLGFQVTVTATANTQ